jgi:hypothetical protein
MQKVQTKHKLTEIFPCARLENMGLFANNHSSEYEEFQEARQEFKEENKSMRFAIHKKTVDPKSIPFDKVHTTIYQGVG